MEANTALKKSELLLKSTAFRSNIYAKKSVRYLGKIIIKTETMNLVSRSPLSIKNISRYGSYSFFIFISRFFRIIEFFNICTCPRVFVRVGYNTNSAEFDVE